MRSGSSARPGNRRLALRLKKPSPPCTKTQYACADFASSWMPSASPSDRKLRSASISPPTKACWMWREDQADSRSKLGVNIRSCAATRRDLDNEADVHKCLPQTTLHRACCDILELFEIQQLTQSSYLSLRRQAPSKCCAVSK